jgi:hypothetical protein
LNIEKAIDDSNAITLQVCAWAGSILDLEFIGALLSIDKNELQKIVSVIGAVENTIVFVVSNTLTGGSIAFDGHYEQSQWSEPRHKVIEIVFSDQGGDHMGQSVIKARTIKIHFDSFNAAINALV